MPRGCGNCHTLSSKEFKQLLSATRPTVAHFWPEQSQNGLIAKGKWSEAMARKNFSLSAVV